MRLRDKPVHRTEEHEVDVEELEVSITFENGMSSDFLITGKIDMYYFDTVIKVLSADDELFQIIRFKRYLTDKNGVEWSLNTFLKYETLEKREHKIKYLESYHMEVYDEGFFREKIREEEVCVRVLKR